MYFYFYLLKFLIYVYLLTASLGLDRSSEHEQWFRFFTPSLLVIDLFIMFLYHLLTQRKVFLLKGAVSLVLLVGLWGAREWNEGRNIQWVEIASVWVTLVAEAIFILFFINVYFKILQSKANEENRKKINLVIEASKEPLKEGRGWRKFVNWISLYNFFHFEVKSQRKEGNRQPKRISAYGLGTVGVINLLIVVIKGICYGGFAVVLIFKAIQGKEYFGLTALQFWATLGFSVTLAIGELASHIFSQFLYMRGVYASGEDKRVNDEQMEILKRLLKEHNIDYDQEKDRIHKAIQKEKSTPR